MTVRVIGGREASATGENHQPVTSRLLVTWQLSRVAQELLALPEHFNCVIVTVRVIGGREARGTGENHQHVTSRLLVTWQLSRVEQELLTLPEHFN